MIKIQDEIIKYLDDVSLEELKTYLVIMRYITENIKDIEEVKLRQILKSSQVGLIHNIRRLRDKQIISVKVDKGIQIKDNLSKKKITYQMNNIDTINALEYFREEKLSVNKNNNLAFLEKANKNSDFLEKANNPRKKLSSNKNKDLAFSTKKTQSYNSSNNKDLAFSNQKTSSLYNNINNSNSNNIENKKLEKNKDLQKAKAFGETEDSKKKLTILGNDQKSISKDKKQREAHNTMSKTVKKIRNLSIKNQAVELVAYFKQARLKKFPQLYFDDNFNLWEHRIAQKLFRHYSKISMKDWKGAIDHFMKDAFWAPKLNSLKLVEKHIQQYLSTKARKQSKHKIEVIK